MRTLAAFALALGVAALGVAVLGVAAPAAAQPSWWYDASDFVATLRPDDRRAIAGEVGDPSALPLYELTVDLADDLASFEVEETVWVTNPAGRPLSDVVLRVFANAVGDDPLVQYVDGSCLDGIECRIEPLSPSALSVRPATAIPIGGHLRIRMRLRGRMREIGAERASMMGQSMEALGALMGGHGGGDYGLLATSEQLASMSYFFPMLARMRGGRWEQGDASTIGDLGNDQLAHVRARIRTADGVHVAASGMEGPARVVGDRSELVVTAGFIRDFALVASPRLRHAERRVDGVTVRSFFLDSDAAAGAQVLDAAAHALAVFTRRFGPYPYPQLDVAEAPLVGGAGGVEFSGFATVATMFYRPMQAGGGMLGALMGGGGGDMEARRESSLEFVTAHEVAHQWWHGIVGSDSRRHPFQDECLAQYSAMLYVADRYGAERARHDADQQVAAGYHMMRMMGREDAAVDRPASAFADTLTYGGVVYGKGPYVYPALRATLGDRAFFAALRDYVQSNRFRTAAPRALFDRMARGRHAAAVRAIEHRWLEETHGDDDLGQPDLAQMTGGAGGGAGNADAMRQLQGMLGGQGGDNEAAMRMLQGLLGGQGGGDEESMRQLQEMLGGQGGDGGEVLRGLMQMLDESGP